MSDAYALLRLYIKKKISKIVCQNFKFFVTKVQWYFIICKKIIRLTKAITVLECWNVYQIRNFVYYTLKRTIFENFTPALEGKF